MLLQTSSKIPKDSLDTHLSHAIQNKIWEPQRWSLYLG